jgi:hypothetical protein
VASLRWRGGGSRAQTFAQQSRVDAAARVGDDCGMGGGRGVAGGLKEAAGISACAPGKEGRRRSRPGISAWPLREQRARGRRIYHVGPVGQREQRKSDRGCCGALLSTRAGGVPDGRACLVSEVKRALRVVLGRPRGLGRTGHWAEQERSGLGHAGLEGLGSPAWELGRSAGLRGERGKEELGWVA